MNDTVVVIGAIAIVGIAGIISLIIALFYKSQTQTASTPVTIDYDISGNPIRLREVKK